MAAEIVWSPDEGPFACGEIGKVGTIKLFNIHYDGVSGSKNPDGPWILGCHLPGIKSNLGNHKSVEIAKTRANGILSYWLKKTGLVQ